MRRIPTVGRSVAFRVDSSEPLAAAYRRTVQDCRLRVHNNIWTFSESGNSRNQRKKWLLDPRICDIAGVWHNRLPYSPPHRGLSDDSKRGNGSHQEDEIRSGSLNEAYTSKFEEGIALSNKIASSNMHGFSPKLHRPGKIQDPDASMDGSIAEGASIRIVEGQTITCRSSRNKHPTMTIPRCMQLNVLHIFTPCSK
jgi:hypothetical protein